MSKKIIITLSIIAVAIIGAGIFYACKKKGDEKVTKNMSVDYTPDFSLIPNVADIGYEDGMLVFQSVEHYSQTIDALVEICEQYSNWYFEQLENKLGCSIKEADEEVVAKHIVSDNFFPFNPLMQFIKFIGFENSAYPVLRAEEIQWLANEERFLTEKNPFDAVAAGYVQSALHNSNGFVIIKGFPTNEIEATLDSNTKSVVDFTMETTNSTHKAACNLQTSMTKDPTTEFMYPFPPNVNAKKRQLRAVLETTSINIRGKTTLYYKNSAGNWILWAERVDVTFGGQKWSKCPPVKTVSTGGNKSGYGLWGLVEKYYTFKASESPTYIKTGYPYITGTHQGSSAIINTQIQ